MKPITGKVLMMLFLAVVSLIGVSIGVWVLRTRAQQDGIDVAVIDVTAYPTSAPQGEPIHINVTVENQAWHNHDLGETFDVTVHAERIGTGELIPIGTQTVYNFLPLAIEILNFIWNTTEVPLDTYQIMAEAVLPEDEDPEDNTFIDGTVLVTIPGDIDGDGDVDASDLFDFSKAYGSDLSKPNWNSDCDINVDEIVDIYDLAICGKNYGEGC